MEQIQEVLERMRLAEDTSTALLKLNQWDCNLYNKQFIFTAIVNFVS